MWCLVAWFNVLILWLHHDEPWCPVCLFVCLFVPRPAFLHFLLFFISFLPSLSFLPSFVNKVSNRWLRMTLNSFFFFYNCHFIRHRILNDLFNFSINRQNDVWHLTYLSLPADSLSRKGETDPNMFNQEVSSSAGPKNTEMNMTDRLLPICTCIHHNPTTPV